jgi:hypothetical protein
MSLLSSAQLYAQRCALGGEALGNGAAGILVAGRSVLWQAPATKTGPSVAAQKDRSEINHGVNRARNYDLSDRLSILAQKRQILEYGGAV